MAICDDIGDWDQIGCSDAGFDAMAGFGNDLLESWGFDPIDITTDPIPIDPGEPTTASYDPATGIMHIDPDFLCDEENGAIVAGIVAHEAYHAAFDQAGFPDPGQNGGYQFGADVLYELDKECTSVESGSVGEAPDFPWIYDTG